MYIYIVLIKIHYKADFKRDIKKLKKKYWIQNISDTSFIISKILVYRYWKVIFYIFKSYRI